MDYNPNNQLNNYQNNSPINFENGYGYNSPFSPFEPVNVYIDQVKKHKKNLFKIGFAFGLAIILYVVFSNVFTLLIYLLARNIEPFRALFTDTAGSFALEGLLSILVLGLPFFIALCYLKSKKLAAHLPYGKPTNWRMTVGLTMFLAPVILISTIIINIISTVFQLVMGLEFTSGLEDLSVDSPLAAITMVLSMAIFPAIIEEFCVRGVVLQTLRRYGDGFAIIMSAFIFSILHGNMVQIPYTMLAGIYFGYICVVTGSLWPSMILHFVNNLFSVLEVIIISYKGEEFGAYATVIMLGLLVVIGIIGGIIFFTMKQKPVLQKGVKYLRTDEKFESILKNPAMIIAIVIMLINTAFSVSAA